MKIIKLTFLFFSQNWFKVLILVFLAIFLIEVLNLTIVIKNNNLNWVDTYYKEKWCDEHHPSDRLVQNMSFTKLWRSACTRNYIE